MKSFHQFQEDAAGATQKAVSASGSYEGSSSAQNYPQDQSHKSIEWFKKDKKSKNKKGKEEKNINKKPLETKPDGPGKQKDRKPQRYRQANKTATPKREKGGAITKASQPQKKPAQDSMVGKKTAASKQPPQHKQIAARPVSTAMVAAKKKPASKPSPERKAISGAPARPQINPQKARKALAPAKKALPPADG